MGAGLAVIAMFGGAMSVAIVGYHGIVLTFVTASIGGSTVTLLAAFLSDAMQQRPESVEPEASPLPAVSPATELAPPV